MRLLYNIVIYHSEISSGVNPALPMLKKYDWK